MIIRFKFWKYRISFMCTPVFEIIGVNSELANGCHILMWDFDEEPLEQVICNLVKVQEQYKLPKIRILRSSAPNNYLAYCFKRVTFRQAKAIIANTDGVDEQFFRYAINRRFWTLRVSEKKGAIPELVYVIESPWSEDVNIKELESWVIYETIKNW